MPEPLEGMPKVWKRRPSPPCGLPARPLPEIPSCPIHQQQAARQKKNTFFLVAVLFPRIRLSLVDPPSPPPPPSPNTSDLPAPASSIRHPDPSASAMQKRASIRRPGKVNLQASAAAARAATTEGTSIAEWMGGEGRGATPCMMQCACFCVACRPSVALAPSPKV